MLQRFIDDPNSLKQLKIVDISCLAEVLGIFVRDKPHPNELILGERILNEVCENWVHNMCYPSTHINVASIVTHLMSREIYNLELIDNILRPDYIKVIYGKNKVLDREMYLINGFARINLNGVYNGNLLDESYMKIMGKFRTEYIPDDKTPKRSLEFVIAAQNSVQTLFKHYRFANAVSHYKDAGELLRTMKYVHYQNQGVKFIQFFLSL